MNGPVKMYRLREVVRHDIPVELPQCMYKLKNLHNQRSGVAEGRTSAEPARTAQKTTIFQQVKQFLKTSQMLVSSSSSPEIAELEAKQELILQQLADLKKQMASIRSHLKITGNPTETACSKRPTELAQFPADITIHASPTYPPYSLLAVQKIFQDTAHFSVKSHLHSSVSSLPENAQRLTKSLEDFTPRNGAKKIDVALIWKNVGADTTLILSPVALRIVGEANILRYLARLSPELLEYEDSPNSVLLDSLLDTAYCISRSKTKTERTGLLQTLYKSLGKSQFLGERSRISVADLAASSAIRHVTTPGEVNVTLTKWLTRCEITA